MQNKTHSTSGCVWIVATIPYHTIIRPEFLMECWQSNKQNENTQKQIEKLKYIKTYEIFRHSKNIVY